MSIPQGKVLKTLTIEQMIITPKIAKAMKEHSNPDNRRISEKVISAYAADIKAGLWDENAIEPIVFDTDEIMRNGHHRIDGIISANTPAVMWVVKDAPPSDTYDLPKGRTYNDVLKMKGIYVSNNQTALIRGIGSLVFNVMKPSLGEVEKAYLTDGLAINNICNISHRGEKNALSICTKAAAVAAMYCAYKCGVSVEKLIDFAEIANTGIQKEIGQTQPIIFRNQVIQNSHAYQGAAGRKVLFRIAQEAIYHFDKNIERKNRSYKGKAIYETAFYSNFVAGNLYEGVV